jgi:hypothetical protein
MALVVPTLSPLVRLFLTGVGIASNIGARFAQTVGIWDIGTGIGLEDDHVDNETVHIT